MLFALEKGDPPRASEAATFDLACDNSSSLLHLSLSESFLLHPDET